MLPTVRLSFFALGKLGASSQLLHFMIVSSRYLLRNQDVVEIILSIALSSNPALLKRIVSRIDIVLYSEHPEV